MRCCHSLTEHILYEVAVLRKSRVTASLGQLPEAHLCLCSCARGVQLFSDRSVGRDGLGGVTRRKPGPRRVREKLRSEETIQRRRRSSLVGGRGVPGSERVLVRGTE